MRKHISVDCDPALFWNSTSSYDIIHIHWPDQLLGENYSLVEIERLREQLKLHKKRGSAIVYTLHNEKSHRNYLFDEQLYSLILVNADVIIHLGNHSYRDQAGNGMFAHKLIARINHPAYFAPSNFAEKTKSRKEVGIGTNRVVYLKLGKCRSKLEDAELISAFRRASVKNKLLILTRSSFLDNFVPFEQSFLRRAKFEMTSFFKRISSINIVRSKFIEEDQLELLLSAADIVIVPRLNQLNSGLVYLALSFGKIVVGPAIGNIVELLKETGNFCFVPGNLESYQLALVQAAQAVKKEAEKNVAFMKKHHDLNKICQEHLVLYQELLLKPVQIGHPN